MKRIRRYQSGRLGPHVLPVLVWLVAVGGVVMMFHHRSQRFEILGMAQGQVRQVSATCTGRLKSVPLELFQEVMKGDIVAVIDTVLDNENLEAEMATISAQIQQLQAELAATQAQLTAEADNQQTNMIEAKRRFEVDVENARLRVLELKTMIETDSMLYMQLDNLNSANRIFIPQNISDPQAQYDLHRLQRTAAEDGVLVKKIAENKRLLVQAEEDLAQALRRRDEYAQRQPQSLVVDSSLEAIRKSIAVQEQLMAQILVRREPLVLRSPIDGMVIQVLGRPRDVALRRPGELVVRREGEVVLAGETILTIAETEPREIIAYANPKQLGLVREGMAVQLIKNIEPAQIASSQVAYVGATLERMPECLWEMPNIAQWGHPMLIAIPPGLNLKPGELVGIKGL
jgi:multidrug resistance efflux pump